MIDLTITLMNDVVEGAANILLPSYYGSAITKFTASRRSGYNLARFILIRCFKPHPTPLPAFIENGQVLVAGAMVQWRMRIGNGLPSVHCTWPP